jgi:hypothetical protein
MISDFSFVVASYSSEFTKITTSKFDFNGITYDGVPVSTTIHGIMMPLTTADREELLHLGHSLAGKQTFYVPGTETLLSSNDTIVDMNNIEWVVLADDGSIIDWREHGNYVKYRVSRKVLEE